MSHELTILRELTLLAGVSLAVNLLLRRLKVPSVVGFLLTGILIGPGTLGLVREPETVETLAEIGVVLLLFAIGLEFSLADLKKLGRKAAIAGIAQVLVTASVVAGALIAMGTVPAKAVFFGLLIAPSSTALVFRLITDRGELQAPHGRLLTGVLLVQDLAVVPMVLLVPALATWAAGGGAADAPAGAAVLGHGGTTGGALELVLRGLGTIGLVVLAFFAARRLVPWLIARAAAGRSRETFLARGAPRRRRLGVAVAAGRAVGRPRRVPRRARARRVAAPLADPRRHPAVPRPDAVGVLHLDRHAAHAVDAAPAPGARSRSPPSAWCCGSWSPPRAWRATRAIRGGSRSRRAWGWPTSASSRSCWRRRARRPASCPSRGTRASSPAPCSR